MDSNKALILMASYNGQDFIEDQIKSIINQTYRNWELYIRDDNSNDDTLTIIEQLATMDDRIHLLKKSNDISGACLNFYELLRYGKRNVDKYQYFFLSDQDDVWQDNKIEKEIELLTTTKPCLVYTNLALMKENGELSGTLMSDIHDIQLKNTNDIFYNQIFIWGNTIGINRELMEYIQIPDDISNNLSHDHYLAFYAAAYGKIIYIDEPLTYYRRHGENVSDLPPNYTPKQVLKKMLKGIKPLLERHAQSYCNVLYFIDHIPFLTELLEDVKTSYIKNGIRTIKILRKYSIRPGSNRYNMIVNYILLISGLYKISNTYKNYKKAEAHRMVGNKK